MDQPVILLVAAAWPRSDPRLPRGGPVEPVPGYRLRSEQPAVDAYAVGTLLKGSSVIRRRRASAKWLSICLSDPGAGAVPCRRGMIPLPRGLPDRALRAHKRHSDLPKGMIMMIHFRRNALRVTVAALLSSAFGAQAADIRRSKPPSTRAVRAMQVTVNAVKPSLLFERQPESAGVGILKGVMVVESAKTSRGLCSEDREPAAGRIWHDLWPAHQPERQTDRHRRRHQRRGESGCGAEPRRRDHRL